MEENNIKKNKYILYIITLVIIIYNNKLRGKNIR